MIHNHTTILTGEILKETVFGRVRDGGGRLSGEGGHRVAS